jgi:hypothetical protein
MMRQVFWDSWAFIALGDAQYRYHAEAVQVSRELEARGSRLVTTEAVLTEVGNAFSRRERRKLALQQLQFVASMIAEGRAQVLTISHPVWRRAWELYQNRPDKDWGHTDCLSFVVMTELGLTTAFTADQHFEQAGFTRLVVI